MSELEKAKKVILDHLVEICTVKSTKWVYDEEKEEYIEVDAGYTEKEMKTMQFYSNRDNWQYIKLIDLIEDLI